MHCNSGYYYVTKDLTIWGLCGFCVGILQFCPVCSLWTSRAVGSAYKIVTSVTEKKIKTASQNQRLSFGEVRPARGNRATSVRKQAPSLTIGVQQAVDRRCWERSFGSRRQQVGNPENSFVKATVLLSIPPSSWDSGSQRERFGEIFLQGLGELGSWLALPMFQSGGPGRHLASWPPSVRSPPDAPVHGAVILLLGQAPDVPVQGRCGSPCGPLSFGLQPPGCSSPGGGSFCLRGAVAGAGRGRGSCRGRGSGRGWGRGRGRGSGSGRGRGWGRGWGRGGRGRGRGSGRSRGRGRGRGRSRGSGRGRGRRRGSGRSRGSGSGRGSGRGKCSGRGRGARAGAGAGAGAVAEAGAGAGAGAGLRAVAGVGAAAGAGAVAGAGEGSRGRGGAGAGAGAGAVAGAEAGA